MFLTIGFSNLSLIYCGNFFILLKLIIHFFHFNKKRQEPHRIKNKMNLKSYLRDSRIDYMEKSVHMIFVKFLTDLQQICWYWKVAIWWTTTFRSPFWASKSSLLLWSIHFQHLLQVSMWVKTCLVQKEISYEFLRAISLPWREEI